MKRIKSIVILVGLMTLVVVARGSDVGTLTTFTPGATISSAAVNANFSALATAVNTKQDKENTPLLAGVANCGGICASTVAGDTTAVVNVQSVAITVPGPGTVRVTFNGTAECISDVNHAQAQLDMQIVSGQTTAPVYYGDGGMFLEDAAIGTYRAYPIFLGRLFTASAAGSYTLWMNVRGAAITGGVCHIWGGNMDAMWISN